MEELRAAIVTAWDDLPIETINKYVDSMKEARDECDANSGNATRF